MFDLMKDSNLVQTVKPFGASATFAADAARGFSEIDAAAVASMAKAINGMDAKLLGNADAMRQVAKVLESAKPVFTPTMTGQLAAALKGITDRNHVRLAEIVKGIELPTLDALNLGTEFATRIAETLNAMQMPPTYMAQMREALARLPSTAVSGFAPRAAAAVAGEAAVLAETPAAEEVVAKTLIDLDGLSLAERRDLQERVGAAIAAYGSVVALLTENGELGLASATLGFLVILVSIYRRLPASPEDDR